MRRPERADWAVFPAAAILVLATTRSAAAHAFGQRYDLPVPLGLYLAGAAAAVALSFVVVGLFIRGAPWSHAYPHLNLLRYAPARLLAHEYVLFLARLAAVGLFALVVAAGLFGNQHPIRNLAPTLVWIIGWVGLAYVSAFVGNLWALINPWRTIFAWAEALYRRTGRGRELSLRLPYPAALGVWPGVGLFLAFAWLELVFPNSAAPANIARAALGYSALTWTGMFLFGRERWLKHGEVFSLVFGVLARFAPMEIRVARPDFCAACGLGCLDRSGQCIDCATCYHHAAQADRQWAVRPYAVGLLRDERISTSMVAFILLILSTVLFDGLLAVPAWANLERSLLALFPGSGNGLRMAVKTAGSVVFWLLFLGAYVGTCWIVGRVVGGRLTTWEIARRFVLSLVPIAIAYHLAHYLTYLLIQGQYIIPLASDPFGYGWDLLGTAGYRVDIAVVGAKFAWYTAVITIVIGHVIAVYLAHVRALTTLGERRAALGSQVPVTALMVIYTVTSLSILAEPIVQRAPSAPTAEGTPSRRLVAVPPDAVLPEPGSGRLIPVGPGKTASVRLTYGAMASLFHDGTRMTIADILYPYAVAYRWGVGGTGDGRRYDPAIDRSTALLRERLVGLRFIGVDRTSKSIRFGDLVLSRELLLVEAYVNAAPDDGGQAAAVAPPWSSLPWHVIALMEEGVARGWAAFSRQEAERRGVPWLDPVRDDAIKQRLASLVAAFARDGFVPAALADLVTAEEARARWRALAAFHDKHGHFLATNGPYRLEEWSGRSAVLQVFRDPTYPLGVGSYDAYAIPRRAFVAKVERRKEGLTIVVDVETVEKSMRSYRIVRGPLRRADAYALGGATVECRYLVIGAGGKVALAGRGRPGADGTFLLDLADRLAPGKYTVLAALYLNGNSVNAEIRPIPYQVPGKP
ncbi:MAG: hypothetical protein ACE5GS_12110 [Kiloniellaceae bacterium]